MATENYERIEDTFYGVGKRSHYRAGIKAEDGNKFSVWFFIYYTPSREWECVGISRYSKREDAEAGARQWVEQF